MNIQDLSDAERAVVLAMRGQQNAAPAAAPGEAPEPGQRAWGEFAPPNPPTVTRLRSPQEIVAKQLGNVQAVGQQNFLAGIRTPRKDPIQAAIAGQAAYEAKMRDPAVLKRREEKLRKTDINEWAIMTETLGSQRFVEGIVARRAKVERFWSAFQPLLGQHLQRIDAMPSVTDADRERKMVENVRGLRALKGRA